MGALFLCDADWVEAAGEFVFGKGEVGSIRLLGERVTALGRVEDKAIYRRGHAEVNCVEFVGLGVGLRCKEGREVAIDKVAWLGAWAEVVDPAPDADIA